MKVVSVILHGNGVTAWRVAERKKKGIKSHLIALGLQDSLPLHLFRRWTRLRGVGAQVVHPVGIQCLVKLFIDSDATLKLCTIFSALYVS